MQGRFTGTGGVWAGGWLILSVPAALVQRRAGRMRRHRMIEVAYDKRIGDEKRSLKEIYFCFRLKGSLLTFCACVCVSTEAKNFFKFSFCSCNIFLNFKLWKDAQINTPSTASVIWILTDNTVWPHSHSLTAAPHPLDCWINVPGHCLCPALHSPLIFQSSPISDTEERQTPLHLSKHQLCRVVKHPHTNIEP